LILLDLACFIEAQLGQLYQQSPTR